jgi:hypothetical protein
MLLTNRDAASEAFINLTPYCSYPEKALKPELHLPSMHAIFIFYIYSLSFIPLCLIIFPCKKYIWYNSFCFYALAVFLVYASSN